MKYKGYLITITKLAANDWQVDIGPADMPHLVTLFEESREACEREAIELIDIMAEKRIPEKEE